MEQCKSVIEILFCMEKFELTLEEAKHLRKQLDDAIKECEPKRVRMCSVPIRL